MLSASSPSRDAGVGASSSRRPNTNVSPNTLAVYGRYEEEGDGFVPAYLDLLSAGGSRSPEELGAIVGVDLADPGFWDRGIDIVERQLDAAEAAAREAGRI